MVLEKVLHFTILPKNKKNKIEVLKILFHSPGPQVLWARTAGRVWRKRRLFYQRLQGPGEHPQNIHSSHPPYFLWSSFGWPLSSSQHPLRNLWALFGHPLGNLWAYYGHPLGNLWAFSVQSLNLHLNHLIILWVSSGLPLGIFWAPIGILKASSGRYPFGHPLSILCSENFMDIFWISPEHQIVQLAHLNLSASC